MKRIATALILLSAILLAATIAATTPQSTTVTRNLTSMPLAFTANHGQWDEQVLYRANAGGATMWFTKDGAVYQFTRTIKSEDDGPLSIVDKRYGMMPDDMMDRQPDSIESIAIKANFVGSNPNPRMVGLDAMEYKCNYFIGNDPNEWHTDVPNYHAIVYEDIYTGIDLKYYGNGIQMEYDFIVSPGADFSQIQIQYEGAESISINADGELVVETIWGDVVEQQPVIYQIENNSRIDITGEYQLKGDNTFGFELSNYDPTLPMVIDPVLSYSTYVGGSGGEIGFGIAVDAFGAAYVTGYTSSTDFPTEEEYQLDQGGVDVFITKLNSSGNALVYSTYLGGNGDEGEDWGHDIAVDGSGNAYITGYTESPSFPVVGAYQTTHHGRSDVFVAKLNSLGNDLVYSTYLGGHNYDGGNGIAVDGSGSAFVTGYTMSSNFPIEGGYQTWQGVTDVFVTKLNPSGDDLIYSTILGGSGRDSGFDIVVDNSGSAYVTGETLSDDFPTEGAYQTDLNGTAKDAFVTKLNITGDGLAYSTYLGGSSLDIGFGIAVDSAGCSYVTGHTQSYDFPTEDPYQTDQNSTDAFVTKLNSSGGGLVYSTYLAVGGFWIYDYCRGIAVDGVGNALVAVGTTSGSGMLVMKLNISGNGLVYSTWLGGSTNTECYDIAVDGSGSAYITGYTESIDFTTTPDAYDTIHNGGYRDAFVAKFSDDAPPAFCDGFTGLFCDDFEDGISPLWTTLTGSQPGNCFWLVTAGTYGTSQTGVDQLCIRSVLNNDWQNYVYEVDVRGNAGVNKEIKFRSQDGLNTYDLNLIGDPVNQIDFNKVVSGTSTNLATEPFSSQTSVWYHVRVVCLDSTFTVYVDDVEVLQYTDNDSPYLSGGVGLVNWTGSTGECDISFDNVAVTDPFPHIVFTDATGVNIGENITISGQVQYADGSAYTPLAPGNIGCEDPVSMAPRIVTVEADGSFELTTIGPVTYAGLYDFAFGANYDGTVTTQHLFLPISEPPDPIYHTTPTGLEIGVGSTIHFPYTNLAMAVKYPGDIAFEYLKPLLNDYYQTGKTAWQRKTTSPTGKIFTGLRNQAFDDCSWSPLDWGNCVIGADISVLQVYQAGYPTNILRAAFDNAWSGLRDMGYITQDQVDGLGALLDATEVIFGMWAATGSMEILDIMRAAQKLTDATVTNAEVLVESWDLKDGGVEEFLAMVEDDEGNIYVVYLHPKWENMTRISSWSPVDLVVTNPSGLVVSKDINEIPGAEYIEYDFDGDGELEDQILIPDTSFGLYQIEVVPEEGAADTDSFSLYVANSYWTEGITLVDHGLIGDIPPVPYTCSTFVNLQPAAFDLIGPNGAEFYGATPIPFSWENTLDPNPDHITLFDLIIAPDSLFIDTVVLYDQTDTALLYTDTLPTDSLDDKYFWKVRAHDLWGASTLSDQTYSFVVSFVCGDVDGNGSPTIDIADLVYLVDYMFNGGPPPPIMDAADVDGSGGSIDISDLVYLVDYMFVGGPPPVCP